MRRSSPSRPAMARPALGALLALAIALAQAACGGAAPPASRSPASATAASATAPSATAPDANAAVATAPSAPAAGATTATERYALRMAASAAYGAHDYTTCVATFDRLASAVPWPHDRARAHRRSAACAALSGDRKSALARLRSAVAAGLRELDVAADPDLALLRSDPAWPAILDGIRRNDAAWRATVDSELLSLFEADQADRQGDFTAIDWSVVSPRDRERERRVLALVDAGRARTADDYYHAAMVYQHGETPEDIERARQYALRAIELEPAHSSARWLAAAAEDRVRMYRQQPQRWGTQFRKDGSRWVLYPVDDSVTDDERAAWGVPPLAESQKMVDEMNQTAP